MFQRESKRGVHLNSGHYPMGKFSRGRHEAYIVDEPNKVMRCSIDGTMIDFNFPGMPLGTCDKCGRHYDAISKDQK